MTTRLLLPRSRRAGWLAGCATLALAAAPVGPAVAAPWYGAAWLSGTTQSDPDFADYQWDIRPQPAWGAEALAGVGRWSGGVRLWRTRTTQSLGTASPAPTVHTTSLELIGRGRLATWLGVELSGSAGVGRLALGYQPDRVTLDPGTGTPIEVHLAPVQEWMASAGVDLRRALHGPWAASLEIDHRVFALDTAHRNGSEIEFGRESFGDWNVRLGLGWFHRRP